MAVTKTHPIKRALKAAIDYICNLEKTDGKLLVSAYGCAAETADIASLKKEELYRKDHPSDRAFQASAASYIEFYNTKRPHRS